MSILNVIMGAGGAQTLTTQTFSASTTWVCPGGVTNLVTASGKGSDGVSNSASTYGVQSFAWAQASGSSFLTSDWATLRSWIDTAHSTWTVAIGGNGTGTYEGFILVYADNSTSQNGPLSITFTGVTSVGAITYINGYTVPNSGTIDYASLGGGVKGFQFDVTYTSPGNAGAASTGFAKSFAGGAYSGGVGYPATVTNYSNVAVTPGTSYSLTVASGGYIAITYLL